MTRSSTDTSLYAECLGAMAAAGESFPCEIFAPVRRVDDTPHALADAAGLSAKARLTRGCMQRAVRLA